MEISAKQLQSFIDLYEKLYDIVLKPDEAHAEALSVLRYLAISVIPFPQNNERDIIE